jgi:benzoyl-CoA reductase subunit BamC
MKMLRYMRVDSDRCSGCRSCEVICSACHADLRYGLTNPKRSRIQIFRMEYSNENKQWFE